MQKPKIDSYDGIKKLGIEVVEKGFTALKTNIFNPESLNDLRPGSYREGIGTVVMDKQTLKEAVHLIRVFREAVGDEIDIILDAACRFNSTSAIKLARSLEPYDLLFLEEPIPPENPVACLKVKNSTKTPICMSEGLYSPNSYRSYLELGAIDVAMPDIAWVGLTASKKIANLCETYYVPVAPIALTALFAHI